MCVFYCADKVWEGAVSSRLPLRCDCLELARRTEKYFAVAAEPSVLEFRPRLPVRCFGGDSTAAGRDLAFEMEAADDPRR